MVIGHINPDTDSIAAAMCYAWLLREHTGVNAIAARAGAVNAQTGWVLHTLGLEAPVYQADASPRFERIARPVPPLFADRPLREAWEAASSANSGAPVVAVDGKPLGLVTGYSVFQYFTRQMEDHLDLGNVPVSLVLSEPCGVAIDPDVPRFRSNMRVRDGRSRATRESRNDFLVVDENGKYFGICNTQDILDPPRLKIILVDHNEVGQALGALDEADLVEVIDHHRLGNAPTRAPIPFFIEPLGSTSTLIAERVMAAGIKMPPPLAGLLLAGVLSDTLVLKSPTTTERDKKAAAWLGGQFFVEGTKQLGYNDLAGYGNAVRSAGAGLANREISSIINSDFKLYESGSIKLGISQVEVPNLLELVERTNEIKEALEKERLLKGLDILILMATDVVRDISRLVLAGETDRLDELPYNRLGEGLYEAKGLVSRKKQLLPTVLALLE